MGKLRPFVRKDSYMPNKKWIPFVIGNGYTTTDGASGPAPEYETVTGNPVSFNAITPFPLRQLQVAFSPVQSGSGDPSPDNVRPISGWSSLTVYHSGADTSDPRSIFINLGQTVYSGYIDVLTGVVTVDKAAKTYSGAYGEGWTVYSTTAFYTDISGKKNGYGTSICDKYKNLNDAAWVSALFGVYSDHPSLPRIYVRPPYDGFEMTLTAWRAWLTNNPLTFVYELATPTTIQLTPQEVESLAGDNTMWSNANQPITVEYRKN